MPFTPLHIGPGLLVREFLGDKLFGIWAFTLTQVLFDIEPGVRMYFDLQGNLHETTHNPTFGVIYFTVGSIALWYKERVGAVIGAAFGCVTHLWLDALYHADVAAAFARWHNSELALANRYFDPELVCIVAWVFFFIFWGVRISLRRRAKTEGAWPITRRLDTFYALWWKSKPL